MKFEYDPDKSAANHAKHGIDFDQGDSEKGGSVFICDETDGFIAVVLHHFNGSGWGG